MSISIAVRFLLNFEIRQKVVSKTLIWNAKYSIHFLMKKAVVLIE